MLPVCVCRYFGNTLSGMQKVKKNPVLSELLTGQGFLCVSESSLPDDTSADFRYTMNCINRFPLYVVLH